MSSARKIFAAAAGVAAAAVSAAMIHRELRRRSIARGLHITSRRGIAEERFVHIGGIEQWLSIRGDDHDHPILLLVHGGPGASTAIFTPLLRTWEKHFTIVQWDQRESGKTRTRNPAGELTFEHLVCDGIGVSEFIHTLLPGRKMILMGCSFGTLIGVAMALRRPDLFSAYVGSDQNVGLPRSRDYIYDAALDRLKAAGNTQGVRAMEDLAGRDWTAREYADYLRWTMQSDPAARDRFMKLLASSLWFSPTRTLVDAKDFFTGMKSSADALFPDIAGLDARSLGTRFEIPFFIIQGARDVMTPAPLARAYFDDVSAPVKEFAAIENAGHFAAFTHAPEFLEKLEHFFPPHHLHRIFTAPSHENSRVV